jgi:hypothetical protein
VTVQSTRLCLYLLVKLKADFKYKPLLEALFLYFLQNSPQGTTWIKKWMAHEANSTKVKKIITKLDRENLRKAIINLNKEPELDRLFPGLSVEQASGQEGQSADETISLEIELDSLSLTVTCGYSARNTVGWIY